MIKYSHTVTYKSFGRLGDERPTDVLWHSAGANSCVESCCDIMHQHVGRCFNPCKEGAPQNLAHVQCSAQLDFRVLKLEQAIF